MIYWVFAVLASFVVSAQDIDEIFGDRPEIYFSFRVEDPTELERLNDIVYIDKYTGDHEVFAYANKKQFVNFMDERIPYTKLTPPSMLHQPRMLDKVDITGKLNWDFYPTYDAYVDMMYQFEANFPDICEIISIGYTNEERELLVARISDNVGTEENEPEVLFSSSIHGDETTGYVLMLRLIDYLLNGYGNDPGLTEIIDGIDIFISPLANPDGSFHASNNNIYGAIRGNALGVDMNRNYPDPEDGPHPDGNAWQTETVHYMNFAEERDFVMGHNIHGGEEVLNYPWDTWATLAADDDWWIYVCREYADTVHLYAPSYYLNGFNNGITNGYQWYSISGGRQDYMNYFHQCREYTLEISDIKLLPANQLPAHWEYNYRSFLNYLEQAMYGVRGIITDSATGDPLIAEVYVLNHEEDSSWVYSSLPIGNYHRLLHAGTYDIEFRKAGYLTQVRENVLVQNNQATILNVAMVKVFSVVEEESNASFRIFPNPAASDNIMIDTDYEAEKLFVYSVTGSLVMEADASKQKHFPLDISQLEKGTYVIVIELDGMIARRKFVKY